MKIKALTFVAALAVSTVAYAQDAKQGDTTTGSTDKAKTAKLEADDTKIVAHLAHVDQMEINMGKMARKSGTAQVKQYGAMLVKDHTANSKDMKAFAKKKGVAKIPAYKPETEAEQKEHQESMDAMARIKKLKGAEFDREFLTMMITDHEKTIGHVNTYATAAKDPALAEKLRGVLPVLQRHADRARELQKNMGGPVSSATDTNTKPGQTGTTTGSKSGTPGGSSGTGSKSGTPGGSSGTGTKPGTTGTGPGAANTTGSKTGTTGTTGSTTTTSKK